MNKEKQLENYAQQLSDEKLFSLGRNFSKLVINRTGLGLYNLRLVGIQNNFRYNRLIYKNAKRVGEFLEVIKKLEVSTGKVLYIQYINSEYSSPVVDYSLEGVYSVEECLSCVQSVVYN